MQARILQLALQQTFVEGADTVVIRVARNAFVRHAVVVFAVARQILVPDGVFDGNHQPAIGLQPVTQQSDQVRCRIRASDIPARVLQHAYQQDDVERLGRLIVLDICSDHLEV